MPRIAVLIELVARTNRISVQAVERWLERDELYADDAGDLFAVEFDDDARSQILLALALPSSEALH